ncbi:MAG: alpha-E domain-containing protein [Rhodocyclaceae bacterium]|nr:alpha-E domain-containing protein [Rhodocyclaceae bacterium]
MLSRVAENLYWMARYIERAEDTARLLRVTRHLMLDFPGTPTLGWSSLITISGAERLFDENYPRRDEASVLSFLCADRNHGGSILAALGAARENLRTTREVMPREIWEEINQLYLTVGNHLTGGIAQRRRDDFLRMVIRGCQTLVGLIEGSVSHGPVRRFCEIGRLLERADMTTRILDVRSANLLPRSPEVLTPLENLQWMSVLKSLSAHQMYRQRVRNRVRGPDVVRFILQDADFPRSVYRCLDDLCRTFTALPRHHDVVDTTAASRDALLAASGDELARAPDHLHEFVDGVQIGFQHIDDAIRGTWFAGVDAPAPVISG